MITLAIGNEKGGTGKTTATAALGSLLATSGYRTLLIDADPQASLTQCLYMGEERLTLADVLGDTKPGATAMLHAVRQVSPNLDLVPGSIDLAGSELGLVMRLGRESVLRQALAGVSGRYAVTLIDCPPSLGLLTVNALAAAQGVIIPTLPAAADLRGLRLFLSTLEQLRPLNPGLQLVGVMVNQYDSRLPAHREALAALEGAGLHVLQPPIPRSVRAQEAAGAGQPVTEYDPTGKVTQAYQEIIQEVITWLEKSRT